MSGQTQTAKRQHANFTLVVKFKPEFYRTDPTTGEVKTSWTYRSDLMQERAAKKGFVFNDEVDVLGYVYNTLKDRFMEAVFYCNMKDCQPLIASFNSTGEMKYPKDPEDRKTIFEWLKRTV